MDKLIETLPSLKEGGSVRVIRPGHANEHNVCTKDNVAAANAKRWRICDYMGEMYEGSEVSAGAGVITMTVGAPAGTSLLMWIKAVEGATEPIAVEGVNETFKKGWNTFTTKGSTITIRGAVAELKASGCHLTELNLSKNKKLEELYCMLNQLTELDLTANTKLAYLLCNNNKLTRIKLGESKLVDVTIEDNQIKAKEMQAFFDALPDYSVKTPERENPTVVAVKTQSETEGNECTTKCVKTAKAHGWTVTDRSTNEEYPGQDISGKVTMKTKHAVGDKIVIVSVLPAPGAGEVTIDGVQEPLSAGYAQYTLTKDVITITGNVAELRVPGIGLTSLDVSQMPGLKILDCSNNELTALKLTDNVELEELDCMLNKIAELDLTGLHKLNDCQVSFNNLKDLTFDKLPSLEGFALFNNEIKEDQMKKIVEMMPQHEIDEAGIKEYKFLPVNFINTVREEQNECSEELVTIALEKGWTVYDYNGGSITPYLGYDPNKPADHSQYITFETDLKVGDIIRLEMHEKGKIDIEGLEGNFVSAYNEYKLTSNKVTIYGRLKEFLVAEGSKIKSIDVNHMPELEVLWLHQNENPEKPNTLKTLDISGLKKLKYFVVNNTRTLENLSITGCDKLNDFHASRCAIKTLTIKDCPNLTMAEFVMNRISEEEMGKTVAGFPDVTHVGKDCIALVYDSKANPKYGTESNYCNTDHVKTLTDKGWLVRDNADLNNGIGIDFAGLPVAITHITGAADQPKIHFADSRLVIADAQAQAEIVLYDVAGRKIAAGQTDSEGAAIIETNVADAASTSS